MNCSFWLQNSEEILSIWEIIKNIKKSSRDIAIWTTASMKVMSGDLESY